MKFLRRPVVAPIAVLVMHLVAMFVTIRVSGDTAITIVVMDVVGALVALAVMWASKDVSAIPKAKKVKPSHILGSIGAAVGVWVVGAVASTWVIMTFSDAGAGSDTRAASMGIMYAVLALSVAPVSEELMMRGALFGRLCATRLPVVLCAVISTAVFVGLHGTLEHIAPTTLLGLLSCYIYYSTGRIWLSMIVHFVFNSLSILVGVIGFNVPAVLITTPVVLVLVSVTIGVLLAFLSTCKKYEAQDDNDDDGEIGAGLTSDSNISCDVDEGSETDIARKALLNAVMYANCIERNIHTWQWAARKDDMDTIVPKGVQKIYDGLRDAEVTGDDDSIAHIVEVAKTCEDAWHGMFMNHQDDIWEKDAL